MPTDTFKRLRDEKQEAIMRAAIHEFVENGFSRAKISDIAGRAGIAKGSIFQYFADKKELFLYASEWGLDVFMKKVTARMSYSEMDAFEYMQEDSVLLDILREERELAMFMQVAMNEPGLLDASMKGMYDVARIYTEILIKNGKEKGTLRTDIDDELMIEYFYAVTDRFSRRWLNMNTGLPTELTEESKQNMTFERGQMIELLKKGMGG